MYTSKNKFYLLVLNSLIGFYPVAYALGNLLINLNTILIIFLGLFIYRTKIFYLGKNILNKLIFIFFIYIVLITLIKNYNGSIIAIFEIKEFIKSLAYLRYLLLYLIVYKLIEKNELNIRYFYISSFALCLFLMFDLGLQFATGFDIFGYEQNYKFRLSGFFGAEYIAGAYLLNFSLFAITGTYLIFKRKEKFFNYKYFLFFCFLFVCFIFITGNRMPLLLFFLVIIIFSAFRKKLRKNILISFSALILISIIVIKNVSDDGSTIRASFDTGLKHSLEISTKFFSYLGDNKELKLISLSAEAESSIEEENLMYVIESWHLKNFIAGIQTWKKNKIFGGGLRSYVKNCEFSAFMLCQRHPHNYYLEIMVETGLVGLSLLIVIFFISIKNFFKFFPFDNKISFKKLQLFLAPIIIYLIFIFPIKTSGSFFATFNSTLFFLLAAMVFNLKNFYKIIKKL